MALFKVYDQLPLYTGACVRTNSQVISVDLIFNFVFVRLSQIMPDGHNCEIIATISPIPRDVNDGYHACFWTRAVYWLILNFPLPCVMLPASASPQ